MARYTSSRTTIRPYSGGYSDIDDEEDEIVKASEDAGGISVADLAESMKQRQDKWEPNSARHVIEYYEKGKKGISVKDIAANMKENGYQNPELNPLSQGMSDRLDYLNEQNAAERAQREYQEYQRSLIGQISNPASQNKYDLTSRYQAQLGAYNELDDDIKNRVSNVNSDVQIADEDSGLQNLLPWNLVRNVKKAINTRKDEEQSIKDDYGISSYDLNALKDVNARVSKNDEISKVREQTKKQYNLPDDYYDKKNTDQSRNYLQEIEYANNYLSEMSDDPNALRKDVTSYLDARTAAEQAQAGVSAESMSGNTTAQDQADYLKYSADSKAKSLMSKYGYTDEKEFNKLTQYVQELNDYDERQAQQQEAYNNIHTGSIGRNIIGGVKNSANALASNLISGMGGALETVEYAGRGSKGNRYADTNSPLNANSQAMSYANATSDYQGQTQQALSEKSKLAGLVYGAAMSAAESAETNLLGPAGAGIASSLGDGANGIRIAQNMASLTPFAMNAYSSSLSDGLTGGKSMDDAMASALISAGIETGTEVFSVDKFWDTIKNSNRTARKVMVDFLVSSGIEGSEEAIGDVADLIIDNIRYGDDSDYNQSVKDYIADGKSEDEARAQAKKDWLLQTAEDALSGALSGAMGGALAVGTGTMQATSEANEMYGNYTKEQYKELADSLDTDANNYTNKSAAKSAQRAQELANKYSEQDTVSDKERRELYYAVNDAVDTETEARAEEASKAEERANKAAEEHKAWQAHEDKVDAYNNTNGTKNAEQAENNSISEAIPQELRAEQNDSTAGEIHKAMAQAKSSDALDTAIQKGLNSTDENTRKQTLANLDNLAPMLEAKGVATESEIQALKQTDAQIYQAGYTGEEIETATTRQKQIYNAGQQAAIEARSATNLEQRELMTKNSSSILSAGEKSLYTSGFQNGMTASSYDRILKTVSEAGRNGMTIDEVLDKVQADMSVVGGDQTQLRSTIDSVFAYSQEQSLADARTEMARAATDRANIKRFGTGAYIDNRTDKTSDIGGTDALRAIAQVTGLDVMLIDDGSVIGGSQGGFDAENGIIYLNADKASRIASTVYHETGEFASVFAPEEYQGFVKSANSLLLNKLGSAKYNEIREDYLQRYFGEEGKTDADLDKEIACDLLYQILGNKKGMANLLDAIDANNDAKRAKSIKEKLVDWIKNMAQSIKDLFADFDPSSSQRKMAEAKIAEMDDVVDMLNRSIAKAVNNYQQAKENGVNVVLETTDDTGTSISEKDVENGKATFENYGTISGGTMRLSEATYEHGGKKFLEDYLDRADDLTPEQKKDIIERLDWAHKLVKDLSGSQFKYYAGWAGTELTTDPVSGNPLITMNAPGNKPIKSVAVNNGEYQLNIDFSQICKKRSTLNAVINSLVEDYGLNLPTLTESDVNTINQTIKERGYEIACGLCFVDAKRYRVGKWAESFTGEYISNRMVDGEESTIDATPKRKKSGWNDIVQLITPKEKSSNSGFSYFNFATKIPNTTSESRTIDQMPDNELDLSKLERKIGMFALKDENENVIRDENGKLVGIGGYKQPSGKRRNPTEEIKMAWAIYNDPANRRMLSKDDLISSDGLDKMREQNQSLYALVNAHWGAGKPKLPHGATAYGNEILRSSTWGSKNDFDPETAKMVGGVRVQSFSDYEANMFFDYCQMFADMAARKLTSHAYTKESDYVRLFGMTGQKINMSIVAKAANLTKEQETRYRKYKSQENMLKKDADLAKVFETSGFNTESINKWADNHGMSGMSIREIANAMSAAGEPVKDILLCEDETFNLDDALTLQKDPRYADNCGIIWIGISDEQIRFMLDSDDVPMIIPYHSSGVSAFIKKERNLLLYKDYQPYQTTKGTDGKALAPSKEFDFYKSLYETNDPKATADEYKKWCEKNGYTPKFAEFKDHGNYYKLLIDFKVYDYNGVDPAMVATRKYLPQNEIRMAFPENTNEIVVDSLKRQQATMDKLNSDFADKNDGILTELSGKLGLIKGGSRMRMSEGEGPVSNSNGEQLSDGQREFFRGSKAVDDDGNLMVMYHGTNRAGFTVFNSSMSSDNTSFFFSDKMDVAQDYSGTDRIYAPSMSNSSTSGLTRDNNPYDPRSSYKANYAVYLNMRNPLVVDGNGASWNVLTRFNEKNAAAAKELVGILGDATHSKVTLMSLANDLYSMSLDDAIQNAIDTYDVDQEHIDRIDAIDGLDDLGAAIENAMDGGEIDSASPYDLLDGYEFLTTNDYAVSAFNDGYDGVIFRDVFDGGSDPSTIMVVFDPNQIKSINNQNPTADVDIRKSMSVDDNRNMNNEEISENRDEVAGILEKGAEALKGTKINRGAVRNIAMEMKREYGSAYDLDQLTDNLTKLFGYLHSGKSINYNDFVAVMQDVARPVVDAAYTSQASREDYAQFRNGINELSFSLTPEQTKAIKSAFGSMKAFERYYPEIHITEDGKSFAEQWSSLVDLSRGLLDENTDAVDMPTALVDAMEALRPSMNNWEDNTQAAHDMALDIIGKYLANYHDDGANKAVINEFVKSAEKEIKAKHNEWKTKKKASYDARLAEERERLKNVSDKLKSTKKRSKEQIARLRAKNATRISDIRERQKRNDQLRQINKSASRLYQYLVNPTDQNHVPSDLQEPVLQLMAALDMTTPDIKQTKDGKWKVTILYNRHTDLATGRNKFDKRVIEADTREEAIQQYYAALDEGVGGISKMKWYDRMQNLADMYSKKAGNNAYAGGSSQDMMDFLQGLDEELAQDFEMILMFSRREGKATMSELSSDSLKAINKVLKNVLSAANMINKSYTLPSAQISEISGEVMDKADRVNGRRNHNRNVEGTINFMMLSNATPETYMHGIGADKVTDIMIAAQNQKAWRIREANEYSENLFKDFTRREIEEWDKPQQYMDGKITATKAQVMTIYELLQRADAREHLLLGGIKLGAIGNKTNTQSRVIHLTEDQYNALINEALTDKEKAAVDGMQKFMAVNCSAWGNETSMKLYGYEKFLDERYWPMTVDKTSVDTRTSEMMGGVANTIKNMGMTKATVSGANNALVINGALDVYAKHISDMAVYSSWAAPMQDMIRFFNYKDVDETENGFIERRSTKEAIERMFGTGGTDYFKKLVASIQGSEQSSYEDPGFVVRLTSAAKKAAVLGNIRVVVQQPTAIFRAARMIDNKYLLMGSAYTAAPYYKEAAELRDRTSATFWLKNQGNIDGQITQSFKAQMTGVQSWGDTFSEKTGALAGKADEITWAAMYRAVYAEQVDKLGKDKIGTKEFEDAVNSRFDHIMLRTQVYDGTITRSQFMRSTDKMNQLQSAFMAEPVKTYNVVLRDVIDYQQSKKGSQERKDATLALIKDARVLFVTAAANAFMQSLWDAFRNAGDPDEDDEFWGRFKSSLLGADGNLVDNIKPWNNIPVIGDYTETAIAGVQQIISGKSQWTSSSDLSTSGLSHLIDAGTALVKYGRAMADQESRDKNTQTIYGVLSKVNRALSDITGMPVYAIQRDGVAIYNVIARNIAPMFGVDDMPVLYKSKTSDKVRTKSSVYETIINSSDVNKVKAAIDEAASHSNSYKTINDDMKDNLKDALIEAYNRSPSEATKMINRIAEMKAYCGDQYDTPKDKTHSERVEYYKKKVKEWLE